MVEFFYYFGRLTWLKIESCERNWDNNHNCVSILSRWKDDDCFSLKITLLMFINSHSVKVLSFAKSALTNSPFYSGPSIFAVLRYLVWEIWFEKSGSRIVVDQKKGWFYAIDLAFFRLEKSGWPEKNIRVCRTTFLHFSRIVVAE